MADLYIHELGTFTGTIDENTYLAIDNGTETCKVAASAFLDKVLVIDIPSISSLPITITNENITTDMVCIKADLGTPSAQTSDWTVNTDTAGQLTISGTVSGSTTAKLYLAKSR